MRRRFSFAMIVVLVALLLLSLFLQVWALPAEVRHWVSEYPVLEPLAVPGIIWEAIAIACWQAVGLIGLRLAVLVRRRTFGAGSRRWLWAMMGFLTAYFFVAVAALSYVASTGFWSPGLGFALAMSGIVSLICVSLLGIFLVTDRERTVALPADTQTGE